MASRDAVNTSGAAMTGTIKKVTDKGFGYYGHTGTGYFFHQSGLRQSASTSCAKASPSSRRRPGRKALREKRPCSGDRKSNITTRRTGPADECRITGGDGWRDPKALHHDHARASHERQGDSPLVDRALEQQPFVDTTSAATMYRRLRGTSWRQARRTATSSV